LRQRIVALGRKRSDFAPEVGDNLLGVVCHGIHLLNVRDVHCDRLPVTRCAKALSRHSLKSFDHLVGELLKVKRDIEAERLCSLEIDHQLEFGGLLDREIGGHDPIEDFIDPDRGSPVEIV
jgi:hypothetical protein